MSSPKKSVEGGIGGGWWAALLGALFALAVNQWAGAQAGVLEYAIICGVGGMISQVGDLAASAIKRNHEIKDYGKLIPGHGGSPGPVRQCNIYSSDYLLSDHGVGGEFVTRNHMIY